MDRTQKDKLLLIAERDRIADERSKAAEQREIAAGAYRQLARAECDGER